jgi:hypothetical protein
LCDAIISREQCPVAKVALHGAVLEDCLREFGEFFGPYAITLPPYRTHKILQQYGSVVVEIARRSGYITCDDVRSQPSRKGITHSSFYTRALVGVLGSIRPENRPG